MDLDCEKKCGYCTKRTRHRHQIITEYETECESGNCSPSNGGLRTTNITTNIGINNVINPFGDGGGNATGLNIFANGTRWGFPPGACCRESKPLFINIESNDIIFLKCNLMDKEHFNKVGLISDLQHLEVLVVLVVPPVILDQYHRFL